MGCGEVVVVPRPGAWGPLNSSCRVGCLNLLPALLVVLWGLGLEPGSPVGLVGRMGVGGEEGVVGVLVGAPPCLNLLLGGPLDSL